MSKSNILMKYFLLVYSLFTSIALLIYYFRQKFWSEYSINNCLHYDFKDIDGRDFIGSSNLQKNKDNNYNNDTININNNYNNDIININNDYVNDQFKLDLASQIDSSSSTKRPIDSLFTQKIDVNKHDYFAGLIESHHYLNSRFTDLQSLLLVNATNSIYLMNQTFNHSSYSNSVPISEMNALFDFYSSTNGTYWNCQPPYKNGYTKWNFSGPSIYSNDPCKENWLGLNCSCISSTHNNTQNVNNTTTCFIIGMILDSCYLQGTIPSSIGNFTTLNVLILANSHQLTGTIPSTISLLDRLLLLNFTSVHLSGPIPSTIGNLKYLLTFSLFDTKNSGSMPSSIGELSYLLFYDISLTELSDPIPKSIGLLSSLLYLYVQDNAGLTIPSEIGNINRLSILNLVSTTDTNTTIPNQIGNITYLLQLLIIGNGFIGTLPSSISKLTFLKQLTINCINLTAGTIPSGIGNISSLQIFDLGGSNRIGTIPSSIGNLKDLRLFSIFYNKLNGEIPSSLGKLKNLRYLYLGLGELKLSIYRYDNDFHGPIPISLCSLSSLSVVLVPLNNNTCYPVCLYNTLSTDYLTIAHHCLGFEDIALCKFQKATNIKQIVANNLQHNVQNYDSIHPIYSNYEYNQNVAVQYAKSYQFDLYPQTFLPAPFNNLFICQHNYSFNSCIRLCNDSGSCLLTLKINHNPVGGIFIVYRAADSGIFLPWGFSITVIANVPSLGWDCIVPPSHYRSRDMDINSRYPNGSYYAVGICETEGPIWLGVYCRFGQIGAISLSTLQITGSIPSEIYFLPKLLDLTLSYNSLKGNLNLLNSLNLVSRIEYLDLSYNLITGSLSAFSSFVYLTQLYLTNNMFDGTLPISLSQLSTTLSYIDLSTNKFSGEIPSSYCSFLQLNTTSVILIGNSKLTCYQPCSFNTFGKQYTSQFPECGPTARPSLLPTATLPPVIPGILEGDGPIIIGVVVSVVGLLIIIFAYYLWRKRRDYLLLLEETAVKRSEDKMRTQRLRNLPLHKAFYEHANDDSVLSIEVLLSLIENNKDTMNELDHDNKCAFDIAIEKDFNSSIILPLLLMNLPFRIDENDEIQAVDPLDHNYAWIKIIGPTDKYADVVRHVFKIQPRLIESLAYACDHLGRAAIEIAGRPECKKILELSLLFLSKFDIENLAIPHHKSASCIVHLATDHITSTRVALKFMIFKENFYSEINIRSKVSLDPRYVVNIQDSYDGTSDSEVEEQLYRFGLQSFPYILVMPRGDRNLEMIIMSEQVAGIDWYKIKIYSLQIIEALEHMHEKGIIHGDVKPLNVIRVQNLMLIDLDASAQIDKGYSGTKCSSAFIPPELVYVDKITGKPYIKSFKINENTFEPITDGLPYQLVPAKASHDAWSLGMLLYKLFTGKSFYFADHNDNIDDDSLLELHRFSEKSKNSQLLKISDPLARNLVSQLLNKNPERRPPMKLLKFHPFISGNTSVRMTGEVPEFDVFISYRVSSDKQHANKLFNLLTKNGCKVWLDSVRLQLGKPWDEGFCDGLMKSKMFMPIISRESINSPTVDRCNITKLTEESPCDNVILEYQLALELRKIGLIELICPVLIGDCDNNNYLNYFASRCNPDLTSVNNIVVKSIEEKIYYEMNRQSLGSPLLGSLSVGVIIDMIMKNQGLFVEGDEGTAFDSIVDAVLSSLDILETLSSKKVVTDEKNRSNTIYSHKSI